MNKYGWTERDRREEINGNSIHIHWIALKDIMGNIYNRKNTCALHAQWIFIIFFLLHPPKECQFFFILPSFWFVIHLYALLWHNMLSLILLETLKLLWLLFISYKGNPFTLNGTIQCEQFACFSHCIRLTCFLWEQFFCVLHFSIWNGMLYT